MTLSLVLYWKNLGKEINSKGNIEKDKSNSSHRNRFLDLEKPILLSVTRTFPISVLQLRVSFVPCVQ